MMKLTGIIDDLLGNSFIDSAELVTKKDGSKCIAINTNFLDNINDSICLYIEKKDGKLILTDGGYIAYDFSCYSQDGLFKASFSQNVIDNCIKINKNEITTEYHSSLNICDMLSTILRMYGYLKKSIEVQRKQGFILNKDIVNNKISILFDQFNDFYSSEIRKYIKNNYNQDLAKNLDLVKQLLYDSVMDSRYRGK